MISISACKVYCDGTKNMQLSPCCVFSPNLRTDVYKRQDRLNLRAAPNKEAESLGKYYNGVGVQILEELNNGWVRVRIGNRGVAEGYMICLLYTSRCV